MVERAASRSAGGSGPGSLLLLVALFCWGAMGWAVLCAFRGADHLRGPAWLRGLLFSALPLAVSVLVVLPWLGAGPLGLGLGLGLLPLAGEVVRHALFGLSLGSAYALLRAVRGARTAPAPSP